MEELSVSLKSIAKLALRLALCAALALPLTAARAADSAYGTWDGEAGAYAITVESGSAYDCVYGYFAGYYENESGTSGIVTVTGGTVESVFGGFSSDGSAVGNSVSLTGADADDGISVTLVRGGTGATVVSGNSVVITGNVVVSGDVYGGYVSSGTDSDGNYAGGTASGNSVTISSYTADDGTELSPSIAGSVYGNYAQSGDVYGCSEDGGEAVASVTISGGSISYGVYGGYTGSGDAYYNSVYMTGGATGGLTLEDTYKTCVYGGYTAYGDACYNSVVLSGGSLQSNYIGSSAILSPPQVYGGYSADGNAVGNSVTVTCAVGGGLYGGYAGGDGSASENKVTVKADGAEAGFEVSGSIYGAYVNGSGGAESNSVEIGEGAVVTAVYGARVVTGTASGNSVTVSGVRSGESSSYEYSNSTGGVYGALASSSGTVTGNSVAVTGTYVKGSIYGGKSSTGSVSSNSVSLDSSAVTSSVYGGYTATGDVSGNTVSISGGTSVAASDNTSVIVAVYGGRVTTKGDAAKNAVSISDSSVDGNVYGGRGDNASGNSVSLSSSAITGSVYGGYASGSATGNSVSLSGTSDAMTTVTGDVYGGYGTTTTGNSVSLCGYAAVSGTLYGGNSASGATDSNDYNSLYVSGTDNSAGSLACFDSIEFDVSDCADGDVMLTLGGSALDLTGMGGTITISDDDGTSAALSPGETIYLIVASNGLTVLADSLDDSLSGTETYTLHTDADGSGASLTGSFYCEVSVVTVSYGEDGSLSVESESEEDEDGVLSGNALILRAYDTIYVTGADFDLAGSEYEWGTVLIKLGEEDYAFGSGTEIADIGGLTVTGVTGTLIADGAASTLLDGSGAESVSGISSVDLDALQNIAVTYSPADGVTVTGTAYISAETLSTENADADSLALVSSSIDAITFKAITYVSPDDGALIALDGESAYDMGAAQIDVSGLTVVDSGGAISPSLDGDGLVMTLIASNGSVTNLGRNEYVKDGAGTSQTFGYELIGTDGDGNATGATLVGTLTGYVFSEESSASSSEISVLSVASASEDGTEETDAYDLVLRTGTTVTVTEVDLSSLDAESGAQLTLSALSYDFSELASDGISITGADGMTTIENAATLINSITLIDGSAATGVTGMGALAGCGSTYSYSIGDSIDVTGTGETVISDDGRTLTYDILNILTLDFRIDEDTPTDEAMLTVESADLSGTAITAYAKGGDYLGAGYEIVLIEATEEGGLATDDDTTYAGKIYDGVSIEYELEVTKEDDAIVARITEASSDENSEDGSGKSGGAALRGETKSLAVTRLAQVAMIDQGGDLLASAFDDALAAARERTEWTPYIAAGAGDFDYGTGNGSLDVESFNAAVGLLRNRFLRDGVFSWGPVFQYGKADYDSYTNGVTAAGETEYVGGGLFARRRWDSGLYIEGAVTGGYSEADYASVTLLEGVRSSFSVGSPYRSVYAGLAKDYTNSHGRTFKPYVRYYYSRLDDAEARLSSGELYDFGDVDSSRLRAGFRVTWGLDAERGGAGSAYLGAAFQYRFDGSAVGVYKGMSTQTPTMRGGSGAFEAGFRFAPKGGGVSVDISVNAMCGAQEGFGGALKFKWDL